MKKQTLFLALAISSIGMAQTSITVVSPASVRVTVTSKGREVQDVLHEMFSQAGKNFVLQQGVTEKLYLNLNGVDFDEALTAVLSSTGLKTQVHDSIYHIYTPAKTQIASMIKPGKTILAAKKPATSVALTTTVKPVVNHTIKPTETVAMVTKPEAKVFTPAIATPNAGVVIPVTKVHESVASISKPSKSVIVPVTVPTKPMPVGVATNSSTLEPVAVTTPTTSTSEAPSQQVTEPSQVMIPKPIETASVEPQAIISHKVLPIPTSVLESKVTAKLLKTDMKTVFAVFRQQTGVKIEMESGIPNYKMDAILSSTTLKYALGKITGAAGLSYKFTGPASILVFQPK